MAETSNTSIPAHQRPAACHLCGWPEDHHRAGLDDHTFWSNADAFAEAADHDRRTAVRYPNGATNVEASYVTEYAAEAARR